MDRGAWRAAIHGGHKESDRTETNTTPFKALYCKIKNVFLCLFFMYYLCEKYYKCITEQYYIADSVSWVHRLTSLNL